MLERHFKGAAIKETGQLVKHLLVKARQRVLSPSALLPNMAVTLSIPAPLYTYLAMLIIQMGYFHSWLATELLGFKLERLSERSEGLLNTAVSSLARLGPTHSHLLNITLKIIHLCFQPPNSTLPFKGI